MLASGIESLIAPIWGIRDPARRIVMAFACYLDAARTDAESALVTMAGYIAPYVDWLPFETCANKVCDDAGIKVVHGYDLHNGRREFKGWDWPRKEAFVSDLQECVKPTGASGIAFSVARAQFEAAKRRHKIMGSESPYGFCFRSIVDKLCNDPVMRMNFDTIPGADISFILESGDANVPDAHRIFDALKRTSAFRGRLKALTSAPKESTRSLQMADLLAFYSRRHIAKYDETSGAYPGVPKMLEILHRGVHIEPIVAHDFKLDKVSAFRRRRPSKTSLRRSS